MSQEQHPPFTPYPAYKPSGVEWLGDIPEHWEVRRLKYLVQNVSGQTAERTYGELRLGLENVESWTGRYTGAPENLVFESHMKRFQPGDVLFGKLRPYLAKVARPDRAGVCMGDFLVMRPRCDIDGGYLEYLLRSKPVIDEIDSSTYGAKMPRADWGFVASVRCPLPPLAEQRAIGAYLDRKGEIARRHADVSARLIACLRELRQAEIRQAVTRGLDEDARLRASGVEWLGDVPERWEVRRLKYLVQNVSEQTAERTYGELRLGLENVESWTGRYTGAPENLVFESHMKRFQPGDVLFGKLRPYLAKVARPDRAGVCMGDFWVMRPRLDVDGGYLEYLLRSKSVIDEIDSSTYGAKMPRASWNFVASIRCPLPPLAEQRAIAAHLDGRMAAIDAAIAHCEREAALVREYWARLTVDAVTGQVDVREGV